MSPVRAITVTVTWEGELLHVAELAPPEPFAYAGVPLIEVFDGAPVLIGPEGERIPLVDGASITQTMPETAVVVHVTATSSDPRVAPASFTGSSIETKVARAWFGGSLFVHGAILAALAYVATTVGHPTGDSLAMDVEDDLTVAKALMASADARENDQIDTDGDFAGSGIATDEVTPGRASAPAPRSPGALGRHDAAATNGHHALARDEDDDQALRHAALQEITDGFGIVALLRSDAATAGTPFSPWSIERPSGFDALSANGGMFGETLDDTFGHEGLGISGIGEGGADRVGFVGLQGDFIGADMFGGCGCGDSSGGSAGSWLRGRHGIRRPLRFGTPLTGPHRTGALRLVDGLTVVNGRLPPEVIQRIVRQNFGRFRLCYENGLKTSPDLEGRVTVKFVIGRDGAVATSGDGGSDLQSRDVVQCVVRGFGNLSFPEPEGGVVTVVYPLVFSSPG